MTGRVALKMLAPRIAKTRTCRLIGRVLTPWQQAHRRHGIQRALRVHIKSLNRLNRIAKQINPKRQHRAHRKQINQTTTKRKLARGDHLTDGGITRVDQLLAQYRCIQRVVLSKRKRPRE